MSLYLLVVHFDSTFDSIPVGDDVTSDFQQAQLTIQDTNPIWGYCRQAGHCQKVGGRKP